MLGKSEGNKKRGLVSRHFLRDRVFCVIYAMTIQETDEDSEKLLKEMLHSIESLYKTFVYFPVLLKDYHEQLFKTKKSKFLPTFEDQSFSNKIVNNTVIHEIEQLVKKQELIDIDHRLVMKTHQSLLRSKIYQQYVVTEENNWDEDCQLIIHILKIISSRLYDEFEDFFSSSQMIKSQTWSFAILKAKETIQVSRKTNDVALFPLFKQEDDRLFTFNLLQQTLKHKDDYLEIIKKNVIGWKLDRMPITDVIVLQMALCEFFCQKTIPVVVTINEYVELSKNYSPEKGKVFINGILDAIAQQYKSELEKVI